MKFVLTGEEARSLDCITRESFHMDDLVLMERAALSLSEEIKKRFSKDERILILCGTGNNGADGVCAGRILFNEGYLNIKICLALGKEKLSKAMKKQISIAEAYKVPFLNGLPETNAFPVIVDALFGTGLNRPIEGKAASVVDFINSNDAFVIACDSASGIDHISGSVNGPCVKADLTVSFAFLKRGQILFPGREYSGETIVRDIGIYPDGSSDNAPGTVMLEKEDIKSLLTKRKRNSHKGTYGKVLCIAGSVGMAGAAYFSAKAAYLCGAGLVRLYSPEENRVILQERIPEAVMTSFVEKHETEPLSDLMLDQEVVLIGPGIGKGKGARDILDYVLLNASCPVVLDADALNIIAEDKSLLNCPNSELILTPHMGELSRLLNKPVPFIKENIFELCSAFALEHQLSIIAKDAVSLVFSPGKSAIINPTGDDSLSTAGSGDILSGMIAGLIASGASPSDAASIAPFIHGLCGEEAGKRNSATSVTAQDILAAIPSVFCEVLS